MVYGYGAGVHAHQRRVSRDYQMLVEKEIISPGIYWYTDEATGLPRKLSVTPELTHYWHEQGGKMLGAGLTVPVPYEHDFSAHPMTPKDKLLNNAGEVKEYRLKGDKLFGVVDVQDPDVKGKIGKSIRWTSPWISSFTDGNGGKWNNVITHLALTTRPRITKQAPFGSVAAALSLATNVPSLPDKTPCDSKGFCLSRAGRVFVGKKSKRLRARYPMAFSLWAGGVRLADDDMPPTKKKKSAPIDDDMLDGTPDDDTSDDTLDDGMGDWSDMGDGDSLDTGSDMDVGGLMNPLQDANGDIGMEELLCDLLQALGVPMPDESNETEFKRHLYEAAMSKIKELTSKGMGGADAFKPDQNKPPGQQPNASQPGANPLVQQEQQPMYMSLEEIHKLPDPMKGVALAMYAENQKLRGELDATSKVTASLRDAKLKEASAQRTARVSLLSRLSPRVKSDLDAMLALPAMALSMGDGGAVNDPMAQTLAVLEKGLADMPRLLTAEASALSVQPQPTDGDMLSEEQTDKLADGLSRMMGAPPERKAS